MIILSSKEVWNDTSTRMHNVQLQLNEVTYTTMIVANKNAVTLHIHDSEQLKYYNADMTNDIHIQIYNFLVKEYQYEKLA